MAWRKQLRRETTPPPVGFQLPYLRRLGFPPTQGCSLLAAVNTFDRHLLREWLQILGLVLVTTSGLLLIQVLYDKFQDLRGLDASMWEIGEYIVVTIPSFLA